MRDWNVQMIGARLPAEEMALPVARRTDVTVGCVVRVAHVPHVAITQNPAVPLEQDVLVTLAWIAELPQRFLVMQRITVVLVGRRACVVARPLCRVLDIQGDVRVVVLLAKGTIQAPVCNAAMLWAVPAAPEPDARMT